jgi:hypothetical protein
VNWSSSSSLSTLVSSSTSSTPSRSERSFINLEHRPIQYVCKCIHSSSMIGVVVRWTT